MDDDIKKIALLRELLRQNAQNGDFLSFIQYVDTSYYANWHHKAIIQKFQDFLFDPTKKRLMLFVPPQHGKSSISSRLFPAFALGVNPNLRMVGASYSIDLARSFNRDIQRYIDTSIYRDIFPNTTINSKNVVTTQSWLRNSEEFEIIGYKGFYKAVGVMGGLSGRPADIAIIDDPVKDAVEAESQTYRDRVWEWYVNVLETRLHNESKVVLIMTRWNEDDLAGRLLKKEPHKWDVVTFQAIKENEDINDPRNIGQSLWPEKHNLEKLLDLKALAPKTFESLYQQNPIAKGGNKIKSEWFTYVETIPGHLHKDMWIDGAYTDKTKNDPTGILITAFDIGTNTLYLVNGNHAYLELPELLTHIKDIALMNGLNNRSRVFIEPKASGKSIKQMLNVQTSYPIIEISSYLVSEGKEARLQVSSPYFQSSKVKTVTGNWNAEFQHQLTGFPNVKHDEYVDLIGYATEFYFREHRSSIAKAFTMSNLH